MKKQFIITAILMLSVFATGCDSQKTTVEMTSGNVTKQEESPAAAAEVTVAPPQTPTPVPKQNEANLVEMQAVTPEPEEKNVIGQKSATAKKLIIINQTGGEVSEFYVRKHPVYNEYEDEDEYYDDEEYDQWGSDLIQTAFVLNNGDKMAYYYESSAPGTVSASNLYDLRIGFTDPYRSECYFRNIPMETITQITLRMEGTDDDAIPYATYLTGNSTKEFSTLNEVMRRIGLLDEDETEETTEMTQTTTEQTTVTTTEQNYIDSGDITGDSDQQTSSMIQAEKYVGRSLSELEGVIGQPGGSDYEDEPNTGHIGYHYYGDFTVSTDVDDNGNEIITGVW